MEAQTTKERSDFQNTQSPSDYFCHMSWGALSFDPGQGSKRYNPHWAILNCDRQIIKYYQSITHNPKGPELGLHSSNA